LPGQTIVVFAPGKASGTKLAKGGARKSTAKSTRVAATPHKAAGKHARAGAKVHVAGN
jgi:hypothetical protein